MPNLALSETGARYRRVSDRRPLSVAGRLTWRDTNGALRFASVVTRDVSDADTLFRAIRQRVPPLASPPVATPAVTRTAASPR